MAHIRKMQNIAKVQALKIDKMAPSTKVIIGRKEPNVSIRKVKVVQQANIIQMVVDARRQIIFWGAKKV